MDPLSGKVCAPGEEGEVVMKGPQVMKGYLKNQKATDGCITDGWFFSGLITTDNYQLQINFFGKNYCCFLVTCNQQISNMV